MTRLAWGSATDAGRVRQNNQDSVYTSDTLFAVADGMGGHQAGEVASELAIASLREFIDEPTTDAIVRAVQLANDRVVATATGDPDLTGMGTTLCAMGVVQAGGQDRLAIVNVGDSRVYLLKEDLLEQVTDDHSLVATLERQGRLTPAEAAIHPQRNIITRALGIDARVMVDSWEVLPVAGDRYVLCSDGLSNEVDENRIAATLRKLADPTDAARELVRLANEGGGRDNISVVIVDVLDAEGAALGPGAAPEDDRVILAVSGESREQNTAVDPSTGSRRSRRQAKAAKPPRARTITWRTVLFLVAVLAVIGIGFTAITYYGRNTYYIGFSDDAVVVYRGRPGGVLWIRPEAVERTQLTRQTVPAGTVAEIDGGKVEPTLDDAHRYLANLQDQLRTTQSTSVPTITPTTSTVAGN
ncbi:MAG TPA: Stp1/IreP family PP2C-type Ser/Thr phosphatase [Acidimicrobiales bacterium]